MNRPDGEPREIDHDESPDEVLQVALPPTRDDRGKDPHRDHDDPLNGDAGIGAREEKIDDHSLSQPSPPTSDSAAHWASRLTLTSTHFSNDRIHACNSG